VNASRLEAAQDIFLDILSPLGAVEGQVQFAVLQDRNAPCDWGLRHLAASSALVAVAVAGNCARRDSLTLDGVMWRFDATGTVHPPSWPWPLAPTSFQPCSRKISSGNGVRGCVQD